jgi:outer membrane protein assembly complex protein YaeT
VNSSREGRHADPAPAEGVARVPRLRRWASRAARLALRLGVLALFLGFLFLAFLHIPHGRTAARVLLERWGSHASGGTLRVGNLDLRLWKGEGVARAVSLRLGGTSVDVQEVVIDWKLAGGPCVRLLRPSVVVTDSGGADDYATATGLAAQPWRVLDRLGEVQVVDGRLELWDSEGAAWLALGRIDVQVSGREGRKEIVADLADGAVGWPKGGIRVRPVTGGGRATLEDGSVRVQEAHLAAGATTVDVRGRLDRLSPIAARASASGTIDGALLTSLSPGAQILGRIEAAAEIETADGRVHGMVSATAPRLSVWGTGPWAADGRGRIDDAHLVLDSLSTRGGLGRIDARGTLALTSTASTQLRFRLSDADPAAFIRSLSTANLPVATRAEGSLSWSTKGWDIEAGRGTGRLALSPAAGRGLPLRGQTGLRIAGRQVALDGASIEACGARLTVDGAIEGDGTANGGWGAELPLGALPALLHDLDIEAKLPPLGGTLRADGVFAGPATHPSASARLRSDGVILRGQSLSLEADARYGNGKLSLAPLVVRSETGLATITGEVPVLAEGHPEWDLRGEIAVRDLEPLLALAGLNGHGPLSGTFHVKGPPADPIGRASLRAAATLGSEGEPGESAALALELASRGRRIDVERLEARLAGGSIEGSGRFDANTGAIEAKAKAERLDWPRLPFLPAALRRLNGTLGVDVSLSGTAAAPSGQARVLLAEPTLGGSALSPLAFEARADGHELHVTGEAKTVFLRGEAPFEDAWPLRVKIDAAALPLQDVLEALPWARDAQASLAAHGTVAVELPLREPLAIRYSTSDLVTSGRFRGLEWRLGPLDLQGDRSAVEVRGLRAAAGRSWISLDGRAALAPGSDSDLSVEGHVDLADIDVALPAWNLDGTGDAKVHAGGAFGSIQLAGDLTLRGVQGRSEGARWSDLGLVARFSGRELEVERLQANLLGGTLSAHGKLPLLRLGGTGVPRLAFEVRDVDLARAFGSAVREGGEASSFLVSLTGEVQASEPSLEGMEVRGQVTGLETRTSEGALTLEAPTDWSLVRGRIELQPLRLAGPAGALEARAEGRILGSHPDWSATLAGAVDLRAVSPFIDGASVSGPSQIDARLRRTDSWRVDGNVRVDQARVVLETLNFAASSITGEVRLEGDRMSVDATGAAGDGSLRATGGMRLGESLLGPVDLRLGAERVPIAYPAGFRGRASGELRLVGEPGRYRVEGDVELRQAYYTAELDAKSQSLGRLDWQLAALEGGSLTDRLALDVKLRLAEPLRIRNSQLSLDVEGALAAAGTLAQPVAAGQAALREGGELTIGRARVRVTQGRVELNDYPAGTPTLDLLGATSVSGVAMDLRARGSLEDLDIRLSSGRSDLSQTDLVALVMTGRTASAASSKSGVVVAEELAVVLGGALQKGVGDAILIDVSPDRSLLTDNTDPTQRFNIGHRLAQNLTVIYSAALDGTEKRWIVEFEPGGRRFRFRAISEDDSSYSLEATDRVSFDVWNRGSRKGEPAREREGDRLASLRLEGELPIPEPELRRAAKLRTGRMCSALQREQAADRVRARLVKGGWRSASVDALSRRSPTGGLELGLRVDAGPRLPIEWTGDDPGRKVRKRAEQAWPAFTTPEAAAAACARVARFRLQAEGYFVASIEPKVVASEGRVDVALRVSRGPKGSGVDVLFEGNTALDGATLFRRLPKPGSEAFFEALDPRSSRIQNEIRLAYAGIGSLRARAGLLRSAFDSRSGRLTVTIPVREGEAFQVAEIMLPAEVTAAGGSGPTLKLEKARPFDLATYVADRDAIGAWYRRQGWPDATVRAAIEIRGAAVSVRYAVDAGSRPTVGDVRIAQTGKTRESLVRRSLTVGEGDLIRPDALAESRERLSDLGVFRSVEVRAEARDESTSVRDVVVSLVGKPDVQVEYGVRYTTAGEDGGAGGAPSSPEEASWQFAGAVELANPLGFGWKARAYTFLTTKRQTWGVNLDAATLLGRRIRTQLFVFDDRDDEIEVSSLASRLKGVTAQQTYVLRRDRRSSRWHDRLRLQWGYTFKDIEYVESADASLVLRGDRGFATLALIGDERNSLTDPRRGLFWTATVELARTALGSDVDYHRLYGQLFAYLPIGPVVWAQGYRLGAVPGSNPLLLLDNRFRAGGPTTVRGFEQNALGPQTVEGDSIGGQAVAVVNQELRFPLWKRLKGGLFWDAGNVWLTSKELDLADLRQSVGVGLRYMFPFGPLRLEYAWVVNPRPGEAKGRFVLGLGHAF